ALLTGEPRFRVPSAAVQVLEACSHQPDLLRRLARRGDDAERDGRPHAVDHEDVARALDVLDVRRTLTELRIDVVDVRGRRLGDVRIGRDDGVAHAARAPLTTR